MEAEAAKPDDLTEEQPEVSWALDDSSTSCGTALARLSDLVGMMQLVSYQSYHQGSAHCTCMCVSDLVGTMHVSVMDARLERSKHNTTSFKGKLAALMQPMQETVAFCEPHEGLMGFVVAAADVTVIVTVAVLVFGEPSWNSVLVVSVVVLALVVMRVFALCPDILCMLQATPARC